MNDKDYRIRFRGEEIPAYEAWSKLGVANEALEVLSQFNARRTALATDLTRSTESEVRARLSRLELLVPAAPEKDKNLQDIARALLAIHTPEEALDTLIREHNLDSDMNGLIHLAGAKAYLQSLTNEAEVLSQNAISCEQIADLWNEAKRPAPGKPFWDKKAVEKLINTAG
jgi:hypothetical protein